MHYKEVGAVGPEDWIRDPSPRRRLQIAEARVAFVARFRQARQCAAAGGVHKSGVRVSGCWSRMGPMGHQGKGERGDALTKQGSPATGGASARRFT